MDWQGGASIQRQPTVEFRRCRAFTEDLARKSATEVIPVRGGFAVLNSDFPLSYEHNCLFVSEALPPAVVLAEADRVLGGAGLGHRAVELCLERVEPGWFQPLLDQGFVLNTNLTMVLHRPSERTPRAPVERLPYSAVKPLVESAWRRSLPRSSDEAIHQLVDRRSVTERVRQVSHHAVRAGSRLVARCELYVDRRTAQVESVETEPEWRGRGFATAVVLDAVAAGRATGCDLIFLYADASDWPQHLYRRLGFDAVGVTHTLDRSPNLPGRDQAG